MSGTRSPLRRCEPQTGGTESAYELAALDLHRARRDELGSVLIRHVVMVTLESTSRDPGRIGERPELVERVVAHQMAPLAVAPPPPGLVDEDRHPRQAATTCAAAAGGASVPRARGPPGGLPRVGRQATGDNTRGERRATTLATSAGGTDTRPRCGGDDRPSSNCFDNAEIRLRARVVTTHADRGSSSCHR